MRQGRAPSAIRRTAPCAASSSSGSANSGAKCSAGRPRMRKSMISSFVSRTTDALTRGANPPDFYGVRAFALRWADVSSRGVDEEGSVAAKIDAGRIGAASTFGLVAVLVLASAAREAVADSAYETCINNATAVHDASHTAECKRLAEQTERDRADCLGVLKLPPTYCDVSYPP